ncbi:cytochrome P450 [Gymnopus androsaceus JB14]|uniref:Cytochrome P450 n=1 Tax=Gymnopus androsaceus JB14 TaxID=1447944 RepID=A0A6A4HGB3_9AGAR|nr:cytochrome P450 [Gymnopus androsaceus JB14]
MFNDIAQKLENALNKRVQNGPTEASIDLLGWMARTALELIGQSGFGYSFDNMEDDVPKHKYSLVIKDLVQAGVGSTIFTRTLLMNAVPWKAVHEVRDMVMYRHEFSVKVYEEKKRALEEGDEAVMRQLGQGKDILMKDNIDADAEDKLNEDEIIAQVFLSSPSYSPKSDLFLLDVTWISRTFIFAAMDTTSNAMSRILQLLTVHPDVQDKMRQEISQARRERQGENLSYDELVTLPYLDAVCRETMRLYPPVAHVLRRATEDSVVPLSKPVRGIDGQEITEVIVPKGTMVDISIINSNRNTDFWGSDAMEWNPSDGSLPFRILSLMPRSQESTLICKPDTFQTWYFDSELTDCVLSNSMTFIGGSRSCIGFKFSQLEMKVIISMLVEKFNPVVVGGDGHPKLPLLVESAK